VTLTTLERAPVFREEELASVPVTPRTLEPPEYYIEPGERGE
jgi:hypothetical protein